MKTPDIITLCTFIAGGGLAALTAILGQTFPAHAVVIANVVAIIVVLAGMVVRLFTAPSGPAQSIQADAPVVTTNGTVIGTNVSTTSTQPIAAPKGN